MNILGFVFSILLILSFGFSICLEKQMGAQRLRSSYLGHCHANRKILLQCENEFYNGLKSKPAPPKKRDPLLEKIAKKPAVIPTKTNPKCARLNLLPLIQEEMKKDSLLYETTAKLLKLFYGKWLFEDKPHAEIRFLNAFLQASKMHSQTPSTFCFEKVQFKNPSDQMIFYKMLKGTKNPAKGYPSLLEYIQLTSKPSKICLPHADPSMISVLFSPKASLKIYQAIHTSEKSQITQMEIERICSEVHTLIYNTDIFDFIDLKKPRHKKDLKQTLIGEDEDTHTSLKKTVILNG